jgi:hypothetical protein
MSGESILAPGTAVAVIPGNVSSLALAASQGAHVVWSQNGQLLHSMRTQTGWGEPRPAGFGGEPVLVEAADGRLHCLYSNSFGPNLEVYHTWLQGGVWELPRPVSRTDGASSQPALAVGPDGVLHAAWCDDTPGYRCIYYGRLQGRIWTSAPVPHARGSRPSLSVARDRTVHLAWQDSAHGGHEVFVASLRDGSWSVPQALTDPPGAALMPQIAALDDIAVVAWTQQQRSGRFGVMHCVLLPGAKAHDWGTPVPLSDEGDDCLAARLVAWNLGLAAAWFARGRLLARRWVGTEWTVADPIAFHPFPAEMAVAGRNHNLAVAWTGATAADGAEIRYAEQGARLARA